MGGDRPDPSRHLRTAAVAASAALVAVVTLLPAGGGGSAWGAPPAEARWYVTGPDSRATVVQLVGNLFLLVPLAVSAVLRWPLLRRPPVLAIVALAAGTTIELLQWALRWAGWCRRWMPRSTPPAPWPPAWRSPRRPGEGGRPLSASSPVGEGKGRP